MQRHAMAPSGVTDRTGRRPSTLTATERFSLKDLRGSEREDSRLVIGRALVVCTVLAAGFAGALLAAAGGPLDAVAPARAAMAPEMLPAPKTVPRLNPIAPTSLAAEQLVAAAVTGAISTARPDRVPLEYLFPELAAPGPSDPEQILQFGPMRVRRHLVETIMKAAQVTDIDPVLLMAIADKESSFSTQVKARTSSATGLFQFIESTWLKVVRDLGAKHGLEKEAEAINWVDDELVVGDAAEKTRILELRRDPYLSALLAGEMLKRDASRIAQRIGRDLTHGETYLAHFLGPNDAERFLEKVVGAPKAAAAALLPKPARANRPIFFSRAGRKAKQLSVAEVHQKFEAMMSGRLDRYRNVQEVAGGATAYADAEVEPAEAVR